MIVVLKWFVTFINFLLELTVAVFCELCWNLNYHEAQFQSLNNIFHSQTNVRTCYNNLQILQIYITRNVFRNIYNPNLLNKMCAQEKKEIVNKCLFNISVKKKSNQRVYYKQLYVETINRQDVNEIGLWFFSVHRFRFIVFIWIYFESSVSCATWYNVALLWDMLSLSFCGRSHLNPSNWK